MNAQLDKRIEPRWRTYGDYLKAALFLAPVLFIWGLAVVFVYPKVQQIWAEAGFSHLVAVRVMRTSLFFAQYAGLFLAAVVAALVVLEWRSQFWPRYRRAMVLTGVFLLNSAILFSIFATLAMTVAAVPALMHLK
jgi:hypothetical protein